MFNDDTVSDFENESHALGQSLFLYFNYTNTLDSYMEAVTTNHLVSNIHGRVDEINSRIVFGFGDENHPVYKELESKNVNELMTFMKSFEYLRNSKYRELVLFLEQDHFQVLVIGHSCGLSDRTLLKQIFEHDRCDSIQIMTHNGFSSYQTTTFELSRHFDDKKVYRNRVLSFDRSLAFPQVPNS